MLQESVCRPCAENTLISVLFQFYYMCCRASTLACLHVSQEAVPSAYPLKTVKLFAGDQSRRKGAAGECVGTFWHQVDLS